MRPSLEKFTPGITIQCSSEQIAGKRGDQAVIPKHNVDHHPKQVCLSRPAVGAISRALSAVSSVGLSQATAAQNQSWDHEQDQQNDGGKQKIVSENGFEHRFLLCVIARYWTGSDGNGCIAFGAKLSGERSVDHAPTAMAFRCVQRAGWYDPHPDKFGARDDRTERDCSHRLFAGDSLLLFSARHFAKDRFGPRFPAVSRHRQLQQNNLTAPYLVDAATKPTTI